MGGSSAFGAQLFAVDWDYVREWLGLVRWLHVIAAIMWIGITAYFVLVDNVMVPPDEEGKRDGVHGERYWLHGGSFYYMRRYAWGPRRLPTDVYWHPQWYAYTTWLSGLALLVVFYYWKADTYLVDPSVADISGEAAVAISLGMLGLAWLVYDALSRLLVGRKALCHTVLVLVIVGTAWGLSEIFSPRGTVIQIGAILGTWMAGNVVFVFSPAHRRQYAAKEAGTTIAPAWVARSAQRGAHNTYMALPVLFAMLGSHFSFLYTSGHAWQALMITMLVGASLRYFFVRRQQGRRIWAIPVGAVAVMVALAVWLAPDSAAPTGNLAVGEHGAAPPAGGESGADDAAVAAGAQVFASAGCAGCHTLAAARATGSAGPNLDSAPPSRDLVIDRVTNGAGAMPAFGGRLSGTEISAVAAYVSAVAGKGADATP